MTGRSALRTCEDLDETVLQYAEFKALAASDPRVKEKMETDNEINRLTILKSSWQTQQNDLQKKISHDYPVQIARKEREIHMIQEDIEMFQRNKPKNFQMVIEGRVYEERTKAAEHFMVESHKLGQNTGNSLDIGNYAGFSIQLVRKMGGEIAIHLCGKRIYQTDYGDSELGNITRIINLAERIVTDIEQEKEELVHLKQQLIDAKAERGKPFPDEERLLKLQKKKVQLDLTLEFKENGEDIMIADGAEEIQEQCKKIRTVFMRRKTR